MNQQPRQPTEPERPPYGQEAHGHPLGEIPAILYGIMRHARLPWLLQHHSRATVLAIFSFLGGCITISLMSTLAFLTHSPFIFPSLGPTAFLFFYRPTAPAASPHNTLIGHTLGVLMGYISLWVTGLNTAGPALADVSFPRIIAAALSLGLTSSLMVLLKAPHPPAGATTLIVSLGLITQPWQLLLLLVAVTVLTFIAFAINRLAGIPYPVWNSPEWNRTTIPIPGESTP